MQLLCSILGDDSSALSTIAGMVATAATRTTLSSFCLSMGTTILMVVVATKLLLLSLVPFVCDEKDFLLMNDGDSIGGCDACCFRLARALKCYKRRVRRRQQQFSSQSGGSTCEWSCPFDTGFLQWQLPPPPLPFHRRRKVVTDTSSRTKRVSEQENPVNGQPTDGRSTDDETTDSTVNSTSQNVKIATQSQSVVSTPVVRTSLLDLARMQLWDEVVTHASKKGAKQCDADGLYPLHWACSGGVPLSVVNALLDVFPRAARKTDSQGSTPLHFAAHYGASTDVIARLLEEYPKAAIKQDKFGRTPLFHAICKSASLNVLKVLVQADPSLIVQPTKFPSPTGITVHNSPLLVAWLAVLRDRRGRKQRSGKKWEKAEYLLQEAYYHHNDGQANQMDGTGTRAPSFQLLSAAIAMHAYLPNSVLSLIIQSDPHQVKLRDSASGKLPLALAASKLSGNRSREILKLLLSIYPQAASDLDASGQSALSCALTSGKNWHQGVQELFMAAPDLVSHRAATMHRLPPVATAALARPENGTPNTTAGTETSSMSALSSFSKSTVRESLLKLQSKAEKRGSNSSKLPSDLWKASLQGRSDEAATTAASRAMGNPELDHLSTIFELLQKDPSVLKTN